MGPPDRAEDTAEPGKHALGLHLERPAAGTPRTTIEIFAQPFLSSGNYENLKELAAPRTFDFNRYGSGAGTIAVDGQRHFQIDPEGVGPAQQFQVNNKDFNVRFLISNAVFRWEWKPGSTLFLVWQQSRSGRIAASDPDFSLHPGGQFPTRTGRW